MASKEVNVTCGVRQGDSLVKVQLRGLEFCLIKKGALFQEEFYLPRFFRLPLTNWWYYCYRWLSFVCMFQSFYLLVKPQETTGHDRWLRGLVNLHGDASQRMTFCELSCTCIVTSRSGRQPSTRGVHVDLSRATGHVYPAENSISKRNVNNMMKSMPLERGRSRDSRQVRFFLDDSIYFFIKPESLKTALLAILYHQNFPHFPNYRTTEIKHLNTGVTTGESNIPHLSYADDRVLIEKTQILIFKLI